MAARRRILIIEDDSAIAAGLKDLLEGDGFSATVTPDGRHGLAKLLASKPDLALLDVNLPGMTGFEVCREARAKGYRNPIIFLSARAEPVDKVIGLEAGADDYVTKPFHAEEVLARVRAHVHGVERLAAMPRGHGGQQQPEGSPRKLRAVMFTDMKDFSRKMNQDEATALRLLRMHNGTISRAVRKTNGSIVEIIGDAFLVSFTSALQAVQCAIAVQRKFASWNSRHPRAQQVGVRIGIHLGDIIEEGEHIRGDTVNIAARLQQLCLAGSVAVSESVLEAVRRKMKLTTSRLGKKKIKNISQPVTVHRIMVSSRTPEAP